MRSSSIRQLLALLLLLLFISSLVSCAQAGPGPVTGMQGSDRPKLIVYIVGFGEQLSEQDSKYDSYGYEKTFYQTSGIQPFLSRHMKNVTSMVYSYAGNDGTGKPNPFICDFTYDKSLQEDINSLKTQITGYLQDPKHANTDVYLIGHSLGGLIAFSYTVQLVENAPSPSNSLPNGSTLKGIAILDSPLNGVTRANFYQQFMIRLSTKCGTGMDYTIVSQMQTLGDTGNFDADKASVLGTLLQGKFIPNQQAATDAAKAGVAIFIIGNEDDLLWQPSACLLGPNFLRTQYLFELGKVGNGFLYVRSFKDGIVPICVSAIPKVANHFVVVTEPMVQQAILEVFTGQSLDMMTPVLQNVIPTGIPTPQPIPTPTQPVPVLTPGTWTGTQTADGGSPFPTQLEINSVNGNTFTGSWGIAGPGSSVAPIQNGQITDNTITFTTPTQVESEVATYKGKISGNTITGTWSEPGGGSGTFTVTKS